jgi:hypothetical protein
MLNCKNKVYERHYHHKGHLRRKRKSQPEDTEAKAVIHEVLPYFRWNSIWTIGWNEDQIIKQSYGDKPRRRKDCNNVFNQARRNILTLKFMSSMP